MLRRASVLFLLIAGCDQVYGLERPGHDEDGDGTPDDSDPCPHIPTPQTDTDGDGLGDGCDPGPGDDTRYFFSFNEGTEGLAVTGTSMPDGDDVVFGAPSEDTVTMFLLGTDGRPAQVGDAVLELGFTIIDPAPDGEFHETGVVFANINETDLLRGQVCFAGYEDGTTTAPVVTYLELNENTTQRKRATVSTSIFDNRARLAGRRSTTEISCTLTATGVSISDSYVPSVTAPGRIGIYQQRARARLHYLWIATRP